MIPVTVIMTSTVEDEGTTVTKYDGLLRMADGAARISYTEEDSGARTSTLLTIGRGEVTLVRRGAVSFSTVYRAGHTERSLYSLGGLSFDAEVATERLILLPAALPAFDCAYTLTLGGEARRFALSLRLQKREGVE